METLTLSKLWRLLFCAALLAGLAAQAQAQPANLKASKDPVARLRSGLPPSKVEQALAEIVVAKRRDAVGVVLELMHHRRPRLRELAVGALGALGSPRAQRALVAALGDPASEVREAAARALGELGSPRALPPLMAAHEHGVRQALLSIGRLARPSHVGPLFEQSRGGDAVTALAPALAILLERKDFPLSGKLLVIRKVAASKTETAHRFLVDWLSHFKSDGDPRLREELFEALKQFEGKAAGAAPQSSSRPRHPSRHTAGHGRPS